MFLAIPNMKKSFEIAFNGFHKLIYLLIYLISGSLFSQNQLIIEAENGVLNGTNITAEKQGYSGSGYVTGFDNSTDYLDLAINISKAEHYKIEIIYRNDSPNNTSSDLFIDNQFYGEIRWAQTTSFIPLNAATFQFPAGNHTLRLQYKNAAVEPDYLIITPVSELPA